METELKMPKFSWAEITCGEACWRGKEDNCKCSCGGKNHGIWRDSTSQQVDRTCKLNGHFYKLVAFGTSSNIHNTQNELLEKYGLLRCYDYYGNGQRLHQTYKDYFRCRGDKDLYGFPLVSKQATITQCQKWIELSEFKNISENERYKLAPYLLWEIITPPEPCKCECNK